MGGGKRGKCHHSLWVFGQSKARACCRVNPACGDVRCFGRTVVVDAMPGCHRVDEDRTCLQRSMDMQLLKIQARIDECLVELVFSWILKESCLKQEIHKHSRNHEQWQTIRSNKATVIHDCPRGLSVTSSVSNARKALLVRPKLSSNQPNVSVC